MRMRIFLWMLGLLVYTAACLAQDVPKEVIVAFGKGNPKELGTYLGHDLDLVIQGKAVKTGKKKALAEMDAFFSKHKIKGFAVRHKGQRGESSFIIGTLSATDGMYRVHCFFQKIENKYVIHQIRIDKTDE